MDPDLSEKEMQQIIDIYDDSIQFGDVLLHELQQRLMEYNPVFIVFGDHGESFGERNIYGHFYPSLYEENVHVPLVTSEPIDVEDEVDPSQPISLMKVPQIVKSFTDDNVSFQPDGWTIATDYDGRNDRNLIAIRTKNAKQIACWEDGKLSDIETYALNNAIEDDPVSEESELHEILQSILMRRYDHETELLSIQSSVSTVME
jgi:Predicted membrane-associated, metal-dependent hydrolase